MTEKFPSNRLLTDAWVASTRSRKSVKGNIITDAHISFSAATVRTERYGRGSHRVTMKVDKEGKGVRIFEFVDYVVNGKRYWRRMSHK